MSLMRRPFREQKKHEFGEAQKNNIVEIDSSGVDFLSLKTMSLGGVTGEFIDLSI